MYKYHGTSSVASLSMCTGAHFTFIFVQRCGCWRENTVSADNVFIEHLHFILLAVQQLCSKLCIRPGWRERTGSTETVRKTAIPSETTWTTASAAGNLCCRCVVPVRWSVRCCVWSAVRPPPAGPGPAASSCAVTLSPPSSRRHWHTCTRTRSLWNMTKIFICYIP